MMNTGLCFKSRAVAGGAWLAWLVEPVILDLRGVSFSPMLGVQITQK